MDESPPLFLTHLVGAFAVLLLQLGRRTGLLEAVLAGGGTAEEVAARAGVDTRNAEEWLRGMTVAGYLDHADGRFVPTALTTTTFGPQFPVVATAVLDGLWQATEVYDDVVDAIRSGRGIAPDRLSAYAPFADVNTPTYEQALVDDWVASVDGLADRLRAGARVAEIAPGNGAAAAILGRAFPGSTVIGYDLAPKAASDLPENVSLRRADARSLPPDGPFDLMFFLDALHHLGDPTTLLTRLRESLVPGGVMMVVETDLTGDLAQDAQNPSSTIAFTSSVVYCLQDALHSGGEVHSCAEGTQWVVDALESAGFREVSLHHAAAGYAIVSGVA